MPPRDPPPRDPPPRDPPPLSTSSSPSSPPSDPPSIPPDLIAELHVLAAALAARDDHADLAARFEWLLDTLIFRGQLPPAFRELAARVKAKGERSSVHLAIFRDKYAVPSNDIDCAARIPLCGARCCSFDVSLSPQDLAERNIPFDILRPYLLPRDNGRCVCMADDGSCSIYERRPGACRAYDCRHDHRIWIDFDARIPDPHR
jgi:hypothetical protein